MGISNHVGMRTGTGAAAVEPPGLHHVLQGGHQHPAEIGRHAVL